MLENELNKIHQEYQLLSDEIRKEENFLESKKIEELLRKKRILEKIIEIKNEIDNIQKTIQENKIIIQAKEEPELISLAENENVQLLERKKRLEEELKKLIKKNKEEKSPSSIIIEIRAGTGGEEAALFVADLFKMYSKYAQEKNWETNILNAHPTSLGGFKEIIFEVKNEEAFERMKYEGGVHRVQRIPITEKSGRIHTSTASVAILPKPRKTELKIDPKDLKIDFYKASGPGGQYVNKRMTAVRILHIPTGLVVTSQTERSLQQNKENALSILEARLLERQKNLERETIGDKRKKQIGQAKRAEKIRTYNFPQDRLTDHRIKKSFYNLKEIFEGKIDDIIDAFIQKASK